MKTETKMIVMTMIFALVLSFTGLKSAYAAKCGTKTDGICDSSTAPSCGTGFVCSPSLCICVKPDAVSNEVDLAVDPIEEPEMPAEETPAIEAPAAAEVVTAEEPSAEPAAPMDMPEPVAAEAPSLNPMDIDTTLNYEDGTVSATDCSKHKDEPSCKGDGCSWNPGVIYGGTCNAKVKF